MKNLNSMVMPPPPPPPPPNAMEMDKHVPMMPRMMDGYEEDMGKMGLSMEGFRGLSGPPMPPGFLPQPPVGPPPGAVVPQMPMRQPMMMAPLGMVHPGGYGAAQSRHLIDPYLAAEISSIVHTLSTSQLVYVLASLKKFLKHAPSEARRFLINNPQLTYALLHTQFLLGEHDETVLPLSKVDRDISHVNKLERSMHLKPFHNMYEDTPAPPESYPPESYPPETYSKPPSYHPQEQMMAPPQGAQQETYDSKMYQKEQYYQQKPEKPASQEASQTDIEEIMNQGVYPASAALVEEVIKNAEILTNIQKATLAEMASWPEEQKQQVLSIKIALHMRGISVNL